MKRLHIFIKTSIFVAVLSLLIIGGAFSAVYAEEGGFSADSFDGPITVYSNGLNDYSCDVSEWHFVITGVEFGIDLSILAPASIHVVWDNGVDQDIPLSGPITSNVAHYRTNNNLDALVVSAKAEIDPLWQGQFNLSHGPCENGEPEPEDQTCECDGGVTDLTLKYFGDEAVVTVKQKRRHSCI